MMGLEMASRHFPKKHRFVQRHLQASVSRYSISCRFFARINKLFFRASIVIFWLVKKNSMYAFYKMIVRIPWLLLVCPPISRFLRPIAPNVMSHLVMNAEKIIKKINIRIGSILWIILQFVLKFQYTRIPIFRTRSAINPVLLELVIYGQTIFCRIRRARSWLYQANNFVPTAL